jgi:hypothetical protein
MRRERAIPYRASKCARFERKEEEQGTWQVSFMNYEVGYFDLESCRVEPVENPLGSQVLTT